MQISLRSQLIAGTTAIVGASAIAMTPVTGAHLSLPSVQVPSLAQVALAGFDSPLTELIGTHGMITDYLINSLSNPIDPGSWIASGIEPGTGASGSVLWPALLASGEVGGYSSVGLIPQIIDDALPIISQLGYNGSDYLTVSGAALFGAGIALSEGVWNAAGQLLTLDIPGALTTIVDAVSVAGNLLLDAGSYVLNGVFTRASAVVEAAVGLLASLPAATIGQITAVVGSVTGVFTNLVDAFSSPNPIEGAWNAVVDGLLGPTGIPGTLVNLTLGAGVQTGPISGATPADVADSIANNFVPSIRTEVQAGVKGIAGALASPIPLPSASVAAPAAAAPAAAAAEIEAPTAVEAPTVAVTEVEAPVAVAEVEVPAAVEVAEVAGPAAVEAAEVEAPAAVTAPRAAASDNSRATAGTPKRASRGAAERASASSSAE